MNKDEMIKDMVEYCKYSDSCFDCPYHPEDNRSIYAMRWYGGCPDCDKELVRAMGKGYRKVADDEIVIKKSEYEVLMDKQKLFNMSDGTMEQLVKKLKQAKQETARMIFQKMKDGIENSAFGYLVINRNNIIELAKNLGIELE